VVKRIEGIFTYLHPKVDGELMDRLPSLKVISNYGVGVDHIIVDDARKRKIPVGNTPGVMSDTVADLAMSLMFAFARNIVIGDHITKDPKTTTLPDLFGIEITGATVGIVGMGAIGKKIAKRCRAFDMNIFYYSRTRKEQKEEEQLGIQYKSLHDLCREVQFIILIVPLSSETKHLIGKKEFSLMRKDAVIVNVARGGVIDHVSLVDALQNERILGAALDVTDPEPLPRDHPLLSQKNVIITPHVGSATYATRKKMAEMSIENLLLGLKGEKLRWFV